MHYHLAFLLQTKKMEYNYLCKSNLCTYNIVEKNGIWMV